MIKNTKYSIRSLFLIAVITVFSFNGFGQYTESVVLTSGSSWTVPDGITEITVECWGAGGGGAGHSGRGGGGGGAYATKTISGLTPGSTIDYSIGGGGAGGQNGSNGGDTWFGGTAGSPEVKAIGGSGSTGTAGAAGGLASNCTPVAGAYSGGTGGGSSGQANYSGGGGGGAGNTQNGFDGNFNSFADDDGTGGEGGSNYGGKGGNGASGSETFPTNGEAFGGGGGGGRHSDIDGGNGGDGGIIISYEVSCPKPVNLNAVELTPTSFNLTWEAGGTETEWILEVGFEGFTPGTGQEEDLYNVSPNPEQTVTILDNKSYEFYVRTDCGAGDLSAWAGPFIFNEQCEILIYTLGDIETFHSEHEWYPNICFGELSVNVPLSHEISYADVEYEMTSSGIGDIIMYQRSILVASQNQIILAEEPNVSIGVGSTAGTYEYNRTNLTFANGMWGTVDFQLHAGKTFGGGANCNSGVVVDNNTWILRVCFEYVCYPPHSLIATALSETSYELTWEIHPNSDASQWNVVIGEAGFNPNNPSEIIQSETVIGTPSVTVTLLQEGYEFYVQTDCGIEGDSEWAGPKSINQPPDLSFDSEDNTVCGGISCEYSGPSILINEVMIAPADGDGSIWGAAGGESPSDRQGEWIELFNPDECKWIDISCYLLGNATPDPSTYPGGFIIPEGTIVPPLGFVIVRGQLADPVPPELLLENDGNTIEIVVDDPNRICLGDGYRLWFRNDGGWFAFFDNNGVPQDAISWNASNGIAFQACNPGPVGNCNYDGELGSYMDIPDERKNYITHLNPQATYDHSFHRFPDGGVWDENPVENFTYGTWNDPNNIPEVEVSCNGKAIVNITGGTPPFTVIWDDSRAQTTEIADGLCAGTYCVTVIDANLHEVTGCVDVGEELELPGDLNAWTTTPDICIGDEINLFSDVSDGSAPYEFEWEGPAGSGFNSTQQNPNIATTTVNHDGIYTVTVTDADNCTAEASVTVNVEPCDCDEIPDPVNPQDQEICEGDAIPALSVDDPGAGYQINWYEESTGGTALVQGSNSYTPDVTEAGIYTYYAETEEIGTGCLSNRIPVTLTIVEMPELTVTSIYCDDDLLTYTVEFTNTIGDISTTAGTIDGSSITNIPIDTNITITSDNNGCTADVSVPFPDCECGFIPEPTNPQDQEICEGDAIPALSVDDPGAGYHINWYEESTGGTALIEGSNSYTPDVTEAGIYTYYAETEEIETECKSSRIPVSLTIYPLPDATINPAGPFCVYDTAVTLSAVTSGGTWSGQSVNEVTGVFNPSDAGVGNHNITYEVVDGICSDSDEIIIQVIDQVEIFINPVDPFCYVEGLMINLTATPEGGTWSGTGVSNQGILNVTGAGVGIHEITYTISGDCGDTDTIWVTIYPSNIDATMIVTNPSCYGSNDAYINLTVTGGTSPYTFLLEDREFSDMEDISGLSAGQYNITIIDVNGCTAVVTAMIAEGIEDCIKIPNAFTPNGDGVNDTWIIENINAFPDHYIQVFNRWGQLVYLGRHGDAPWDGTYNGKALPTAPYLYIVNLNVAEAKNDVYIGIVTIIY